MPVTIKAGQMGYKSPSSGEYVGINGVAERTTAEQVADVEAAGTAAVALVQTKADEVTAQLANAAEVRNMIAGVFNSNTAYTAGQYVIQTVTVSGSSVNKLFRFKVDHAAGAWDANEVIEVKLANDVVDLKSALNAFYDVNDINSVCDVTGKYINTSNNEASSGAYRHSDYIEIPNNAKAIRMGNTVTLNSGGVYHLNPPALFYTSNKTLISYVLTSTEDYVIAEIPNNAVYVRFNQPNDGGSSVNSTVSGVWFIQDYAVPLLTEWKNLQVADSPNLFDGGDFHDLEPNKIYYIQASSGTTATNMPVYNFTGVVFTLRGVSVDTSQFVFAVSSEGRIFYCRSWGAVPGTYSQWYEVYTTARQDSIFGIVGTYTFTYTSKTIKNTGIIVQPLTKYLVRFNKPRNGRIRLFPANDSSGYAELFPYMDEIIFYNNLNTVQTLSIYNVDGTNDDIDLTVIEIGSPEDVKGRTTRKYTVSKNSHASDFTSVTECFLALKDDISPKIIEIWEGEYDIYQEYIDANIPICPPTDNPTSNFWKYCVFVPKNTHVIGKGVVKLKWMPDPNTDDITWQQCVAVSPINVMGSMTLENVEIYCKNGRYCIHNDTVGLAPYAGSVQKYINVKCYKYAPDRDDNANEDYGKKQTIGYGIGMDMFYYYENCEFHNNGTGMAFYGHTNVQYNGTDITESQSGEIVLNNCIIDKPGTIAVKLGNTGSVQRNVRVKFNDCYFSGKIYAINEDESAQTAAPNAYNITFLNCNDVEVHFQDPNNPYTPIAYRTNVTTS